MLVTCPSLLPSAFACLSSHIFISESWQLATSVLLVSVSSKFKLLLLSANDGSSISQTEILNSCKHCSLRKQGQFCLLYLSFLRPDTQKEPCSCLLHARITAGISIFMRVQLCQSHLDSYLGIPREAVTVFCCLGEVFWINLIEILGAQQIYQGLGFCD